MKNPLRLLLFVSLALATGAVAQENATKLALAREVIASMKADQLFDNMTTQMRQMATQLATPPPNATPEQIRLTEELRGKILGLSVASAKDMVSQLDHIYADIYDEAELKALKAFFSSPAGQSMLTKQPQIMGRIMPLAEKMQRELGPKIRQLVDEAKIKIQAAAAPAPAPSLPPTLAPAPAPAPKATK